MIISASRRTDIPNYYSQWFLNRIKEGFAYVRNPMNARQVSKIILTPEVVDCIVFWTKNPKPMISGLDRLKDFPYYFQFTLTGYGSDIEPHIPHKKNHMIPVFQTLSEKIGGEKVIWRYDPILFTNRYSPDYHRKAFSEIAGHLRGYTKKCVVSFVDLYRKNQKNLNALQLLSLSQKELMEFVSEIASIAAANNMDIASCAETMDLSPLGIRPNHCIDPDLIEQIIGCGIRRKKDTNQRSACGCLESIDIGTYHTCQNGCLYCYANDNPRRVLQKCGMYDPDSPILCDTITEYDKITERKVGSLKTERVNGL
ncbi:MAG: DUF1848 domain-containing protein [Lachnospiraceae bacterium]|nr:DUF1848 domain-containing protein [Lachnospiraceae bacterium]